MYLKCCITVCVRLVAQPQTIINSTKAICAINFTLCYSQLIYFIMKPHRKTKIHATEWSRMKEIRFNYHKFLWTKFKRKIRTKRLA